MGGPLKAVSDICALSAYINLALISVLVVSSSLEGCFWDGKKPSKVK